MTMPTPLTASHYLLSGGPTFEPARHSFAERVRAAGAAGLHGLGLGIRDLLAAVDGGASASGLAETARQHGVTVAEVETFIRPMTPDATSRAAADQVLSLTAELGARRVNVTMEGGPSPAIDVEQAAASLGELADRAAGLGLDLALEFMPYRAVDSLPTALAILRRVDRPNCGLLIDTLHFFRSGGQVADVALIERGELFSFQLADAPAQPPADLVTESRTSRMLPGQGGLAIAEVLRQVRAGGAQPAVAIEVISESLRVLDIDEVAARAAGAARSVLEAAGFGSDDHGP